MMFLLRGRVANLALKHQMPAIIVWSEAVQAGVLMSYGSRRIDEMRRLPYYGDGILKGAGVEIKNNRDALGMRASGSHDVVFTNCSLAASDLVDTGPWGEYTERYLAGNVVGTLGLVSVFLGVAEAARDHIVAMLKTERDRRVAERRSTQHAIAEIEIDLAASRAMICRTGAALDSLFGNHPRGPLPIGALHEVMRDFQCTKWTVTRQAIEAVDRALTLSGGAGYLSKSPLSRLYRDVRAGPFMQPFSPNEALEYIGKVTLGLDPVGEGWSDPAREGRGHAP